MIAPFPRRWPGTNPDAPTGLDAYYHAEITGGPNHAGDNKKKMLEDAKAGGYAP